MIQQTATPFSMGTDTYQMTRYEAAGGSKTRPAVVFLHGTDGLAGESGTEIKKFAEQLAADGFLVFVPNYFGNDGEGTLPPLELYARRIQAVSTFAPRVAAAIDRARAEPGVAPDQLALVGLSLGGGLALQYAASRPKGDVDAVVDFFGYVAPESTVYRDAARLPPTLIFHNKQDKIVSPSFSTRLRDALTKSRVTHEHYENDDDYAERQFHPFRPGGKADVESRSRTRAWLKKYVTKES